MTATTKIPLVDLQAQYQTIAPDINAAIQGVLDRGDYILGDEVRLFEDDFAKYIGTAHALSVGSGLDALELALRAYGIGTGDEVITAANTFIATALAIIAVGAKPVLAEMIQLLTTSRPLPSRQPSLRGRAESCRCTCTASPLTWNRSWRSPENTTC